MSFDRANFNSPAFIDSLRQRDHEAVTALVRAYTAELLKAGLGLGFDQLTSKELVQRVWTAFFDAIADFRGESQIRTFVFGILYNKASELWREQKRAEPVELSEDVIDDRFDSSGSWIKPPLDPEELFLGTETLDEIQKCLDLLPMNQRMAFVLKEVEERETPEITSILGITISNLGVLLYRARKHLRDCLLCKPNERKA